jgi:hypothetical protein
MLLSSAGRTFSLDTEVRGALSRLIQTQCDALLEAETDLPRSAGSRPFTADDLDLLEPLFAWLNGR